MRQRGIALLTAIILVAVAAIVATAIAWQSQLAARRGSAAFTIAQSLALAEGAEALAAYALQDNLQRTPNPPMGSNYPTPNHLGPVQIDSGGVSGVLEATVEDQTGKFNLNSVVTPAAGGALPNQPIPLVKDQDGFTRFSVLLTNLNISANYAARLVDWIDTDDVPTFPDGAEDSFYLALQPAHRTLNMPLTNISELLAMGMDRASYDKLAPFVTALPVATKLNLCTASGEVLDAYAGQVSFSLDPKQLAGHRNQAACFPTVQDFQNSVVPNLWPTISGHIDSKSKYFRLRTWITIGTTRFTLYSLIYQDSNGQIRPIFRTFGTE